MALYAVLAALVWFTMGGDSVLVYGRPVEMRLVPLHRDRRIGVANGFSPAGGEDSPGGEKGSS